MKDKILQACLRELHWVTAMASCEIKTVYLEGKNNRISDALSRWHLHLKYLDMFYQLVSESHLNEEKVGRKLWDFILKCT